MILKQVIFKEKIEILFPDNGNNIVYIDKNKEQTILQVYIRSASIEEIKRKIKINYKKYHPETELNQKGKNET